MASVSKHKFEWAVGSVAHSRLEAKSFSMQVLDLEVRCSASIAMAHHNKDSYCGNCGSGQFYYKQDFVYELAWDHCESKHILYSCEVKILNERTELWSDKKTTPEQGLVCSSVSFPRGAATLYANNGRMTVIFEFEFSLQDLKKKVKKSFMTMLKEKVLTDVVIVCEDKSFDCHKLILARHSEVFEKMLTGSFKEAREGKIIIESFTSDVVESVIDYIYSDHVSENVVTWELYEAAKLYALPGLQNVCIRSLRKNLNVDNCCKMLEASFKHDLDDMFEYAMEFVKKNKSKVAKTEGWKAVTKNNDLLAKMFLHPI